MSQKYKVFRSIPSILVQVIWGPDFKQDSFRPLHADTQMHTHINWLINLCPGNWVLIKENWFHLNKIRVEEGVLYVPKGYIEVQYLYLAPFNYSTGDEGSEAMLCLNENTYYWMTLLTHIFLCNMKMFYITWCHSVIFICNSLPLTTVF